jgi:hypothetical protein
MVKQQTLLLIRLEINESTKRSDNKKGSSPLPHLSQNGAERFSLLLFSLSKRQKHWYSLPHPSRGIINVISIIRNAKLQMWGG